METCPVPLRECPPDGGGWPLWCVQLEVVGHLWWPQWEGHAVNSIDATSRARRWFYGEAYRERGVRELLPLRVVSVCQVGV